MAEIHRQAARNPRRRRGLGGLVMIIVVVGVFAFVAALMGGIDQRIPYEFTPVERPATVATENPISLVRRGIPLTSSKANPLPVSPDVKAIVVQPKYLKVLVGGQVQREVKLAQPLTTLQQVVDTVANPQLISYGNGTVMLAVPLILDPDVTMTIGSPALHLLALVGPQTFVGSNKATLTFDGVKVSGDDDQGAAQQPFILADGGTMNAAHSTFTDLGWDWNSAYGVTWGNNATGRVEGCTFQANFIGLYARAATMTITDSVFQQSKLYGLELNGSNNVNITKVTVEGSRSHGILFSGATIDSGVRGSVVRNNGGNGLLLSPDATRNGLVANQVYSNRGDGVGVNGNSNWLANNTLRSNRIGLNVGREQEVMARDNTIANNYQAVSGVPHLDPSNHTFDNGNQYKKGWLQREGVVVAIVLLVACGCYLFRRWQLNRRERLAQS